ncbi:MAG: hydantoinase/oxoprolinase N-terminal domain-containing protein, partial [Planctomycetota bacterium]|nr:hydantoinase/oxoprolinase N-terminal domain-containing protein [Planctomycetota bacterium]
MASDPRSTTTGSFPAASAGSGPLRVGIDTGGTFTDVVLEGASASPRVVKVRSTPDDPARALLDGLGALGLTAEERGRVQVVHGTTVALNALLQGRTPAVALVTNEGFQDLVEIDRQARPDLYALEPVRPAPLAPRELRFELGQRTVRAEAGAFVEERRPTDEEVARVADAVAASGAQSAAVCLLHSYGDPGPERRVAEALRARGVA